MTEETDSHGDLDQRDELSHRQEVGTPCHDIDSRKHTMNKAILFLVLALPLSHCARSPRAAAREEDPSIVFPHFYEQVAVEVGARDGTYELDGATLRALALAADDFLPDTQQRACWDRQESHRYRVIRHQGIIFVRIDEDPEACGQRAPALHSGASYAVSREGRILRRLIDGQPMGPFPPDDPDAGDMAVPAKPGVSSQLQETQVDSGHAPRLPWPDGGIGPKSPAPSPIMDGGPGEPPRPP